MKRTALLAVLILALGGARLEAGIVAAGNGARLESDVERTSVRFTAEYESPIGGYFSCVGFRFSSRSLARDTEKCIFADLSTFPPGTYLGNPNFIVNGTSYTWNSDYDGQLAIHIRLIVTDNGDGRGLSEVEAYY